MALPKTSFTRDIVLDQEAFQTASQRLTDLSEKMQKLHDDVSNALDNLRTGFDTPAGHKFFKVCGDKLLAPMKDQSLVIEHISKNLRNAQNSYQSVFDEFANLNTSIRNINNN